MKHFIYYVPERKRYVKNVSDGGKVTFTKSHLSAQFFDASSSVLKQLHEHFNGLIYEIDISEPALLSADSASELVKAIPWVVKPIKLGVVVGTDEGAKEYGDKTKTVKMLDSSQMICEVERPTFRVVSSSMVYCDANELVSELEEKLADLYANKVVTAILFHNYVYDKQLSALRSFCESRGMYIAFGNQNCIVVFRSQAEYLRCKKIKLVLYENAYRTLTPSSQSDDLSWATSLLSGRLDKTLIETLETSSFSAPSMKDLKGYCEEHKHPYEVLNNGNMRIYYNEYVEYVANS